MGQGEGGQGIDEDEVRIPGAEEYRPPEAFREDILDARRKGETPEDWPEDWDEQRERYYQELVR